MVGIVKTREDIDIRLRDSFFEKRGYGITNPGFEKKLNDIFTGKDNSILVQCQCGDLVFFNDEIFKLIKPVIKDNKWCKRCQLGLPPGIDFSINVRTAKVENLMEDFEFDYEHKIINCPLYKFREIKKIGDGLFPANNVFEFLYGYGYFGRDWLRNLAGIITIAFHQKYDKAINALVNDIYKRNQSDTLRLFDLISHDHMQSLNTHEKIDNINQMIERDSKSEKKGYNSTEEDIKIGHDEASVLLTINSYNQSFEVQAILDVLKNIENILSGQPILDEPFSGIRFQTPDGITKTTNSKANQVEYLINSRLPQDIKTVLKEIYDNHLRNAFSHNEFKIHLSFKKVELIHYKEIRTFEQIVFMKEAISYFQTILLSSIEELVQNSMVEKQRDFGIVNIELTYNQKKQPILRFKQYLYFINRYRRYFPIPRLSYSERHKSIQVNFGDSEYPFFLPYNEANLQWINDVLKDKNIKLERETIVPLFDIYKSKSITLVKLDWEICHVLAIHRYEVKLQDEIITKMKSFLPKTIENSPLLQDYSTKIQTRYSESELRTLQYKDLEEFTKESDSVSINEMPFNIWKDEFLNMPEIKMLKLNMKDSRTQFDIYQITDESDDDYTLFDLYLNQFLYVEKRSLSEELNIGDYIKAKIVSFTYKGMARDWDFLEVYKPMKKD